MDPKFLSVQDLLKSFLFKIPKYQRPYSWTKEELGDLHSDIMNVYNTKNEHFMATLVTVKLDPQMAQGISYERLEVVDGQQRLTSIAILIRAIANALPKKDGYVKTINNLLVKNNNNALLIIDTNYDTKSIFSNYIRFGKEPPNTYVPKTITEESLVNAIKTSEKFILNQERFSSLEDIRRLFDTILQQLKFLLHVLENKQSVYTTFEVLNSRGKSVGTIDKCKSILLGRVALMDNSHDKINEINKEWEQIFGAIGITKINTDELVRMAVTLLDNSHTRSIKSSDEAIAFFKQPHADYDTILKWHETLVDIARLLSIIENETKLKAIFKIMQVKFLYLVIQLRQEKENDLKHKELILKQLENVSFRIYGLDGLDSRKKRGDYFEIAQKIIERISDEDKLISEDEIKYEIKKLGTGYEIEKVIGKIQETDLYASTNWKEELRYFFYKYEEYLAEKSRKRIKKIDWTEIWKNTAESSIEHILPQKAQSNPAWDKVMGEFAGNQDLEKLTMNRLGNFLILPPQVNSSAKNKSFKKKREIYKSGSTLLLVDEFLNDNDRVWNKQKIINREEKLLNAALEIWKDVY
jgi:hypothetical protein